VNELVVSQITDPMTYEANNQDNTFTFESDDPSLLNLIIPYTVTVSLTSDSSVTAQATGNIDFSILCDSSEIILTNPGPFPTYTERTLGQETTGN